MTATKPYFNVFFTAVATVVMTSYVGQQLAYGLLPPVI